MESRLRGRHRAGGRRGDDDGYAPTSYLAADASREPSQLLEAEETADSRRGLHRALNALDARSRRIIEERWLRENDSGTLHELADEFMFRQSASARSRSRR